MAKKPRSAKRESRQLRTNPIRVTLRGDPSARQDGCYARDVGHCSMDMLAVDLSELPQAGVGSRVELWGANVGVAEVAAHAGQLTYELLCNVKRVPFEYVEAANSATETGS